MRIEIQVGILTEEQERQKEEYYRAVKILRDAGFEHAHVRGLCVFSPTDPVAHIKLEKP